MTTFDVYISKPPRFWAIQWTGFNDQEVENFLIEFWASSAWVNRVSFTFDRLNIGMIYGDKPVMYTVKRGQWIVKPQWDQEILILTREEFEPHFEKEKS